MCFNRSRFFVDHSKLKRCDTIYHYPSSNASMSREISLDFAIMVPHVARKKKRM
jgi:hypothetical protein